MINTSEVLRGIARMKYRVMRLSGYITVLNTVILIFGFGWKWWYLPALCFVVVAYLFEKKHGIAGEMDVAYSQSREWQELKQKIDDLSKRGRLP